MINCCYCCFGMFQLVGARPGEEVKEIWGRLSRAGGADLLKKGDDRQGSDRMDTRADKKIQRVSEMTFQGENPEMLTGIQANMKNVGIKCECIFTIVRQKESEALVCLLHFNYR